VEKTLNRKIEEVRPRGITPHILIGILLYYLVLAFNLTMTFWIGEQLLGMVGIFIYLPITVILLARLARVSSYRTN
jgi:putative membrane protein